MNNLLLAANGLMVFLYAINYRLLPPQIPLFYSRPWGEDQLGDNWMLFLLIFVMDAFFYLNRFLVRKFFTGNRLMEKIFEVANLFIIISFFLLYIKLIFLVI